MPSEGYRIVRDPKSGIIMIRCRHNRVCGNPEHLLDLAALLIRAAYEGPKGMHDAPPLPKSDWTPGD